MLSKGSGIIKVGDFGIVKTQEYKTFEWMEEVFGENRSEGRGGKFFFSIESIFPTFENYSK